MNSDQVTIDVTGCKGFEARVFDNKVVIVCKDENVIIKPDSFHRLCNEEKTFPLITYDKKSIVPNLFVAIGSGSSSDQILMSQWCPSQAGAIDQASIVNLHKDYMAIETGETIAIVTFGPVPSDQAPVITVIDKEKSNEASIS